MTATSDNPDALQWRESWPPSRIHLQPVGQDTAKPALPDYSMDLSSVDDNPLIYFLTPAAALPSEDDDGDIYAVDDPEDLSYRFGQDAGIDCCGAMDMDFDAGIEDDNHPQPAVRSVSPSFLAETLLSSRLPRIARPPTPPRSGRAPLPDTGAVAAAIDADEDEEQYVHLGDAAYAFGQQMSLSPASSPALSHPLTGAFHTSASSAHHRRAGAMIPRRRSPRSWRVPSPDVFMIEEEADEDVGPNVPGALNETASGAPVPPSEDGNTFLDIEAAKPQGRKRVRFVLPQEHVS